MDKKSQICILIPKSLEELPENIQQKIEARKKARAEKNWTLSDQLRDVIQTLGYVVQDSKDSMTVFKK